MMLTFSHAATSRTGRSTQGNGGSLPLPPDNLAPFSSHISGSAMMKSQLLELERLRVAEPHKPFGKLPDVADRIPTYHRPFRNLEAAARKAKV
jgi:hypothetical protein